MLHVTNGDAAAEAIRALALPGEVLPWRDVLHEGPVPAPATLDSLRPLRARFLAGYGGSAVEIAAQLEQRDRTLAAARGGAIALWFEHDLYDQLQLAQILDWCAAAGTRPLLIQASDYLTHVGGPQLRALWEARREVTGGELAAAQAAWSAFTAPDPRTIEGALDGLAALPHLRPALVRHLEEFPAIDTGLARSERQILEALASGPLAFGDLFRAAHHEREDPIFLGDATFRDRLQALAAGDAPLVAVENGGAAITDAGHEVLAGRRDRVETLGLDRWLGGVRLRGRRAPFRWDPRARRIAAS